MRLGVAPADGSVSAGRATSTALKHVISQITEFTSSCPLESDEVEQAVDGKYVDEEWIGCNNGMGRPRVTAASPW